MKSATTIERPSLETLRTRLAEVRAMQLGIPNELADAEISLTVAKDADRFARRDAIRVRALGEIGQASPSDVRAAEHAANLAAEALREADDRLAVVVEKMPALAGAYSDTLEALRVTRLPGLRDESTRVVERIDRAVAELIAACAAGEPLADEIKRDFAEATNATGHRVFDARLPYTLVGLLTFGSKQRIGQIAERWRALRARG